METLEKRLLDEEDNSTAPALIRATTMDTSWSMEDKVCECTDDEWKSDESLELEDGLCAGQAKNNEDKTPMDVITGE